MFSACRRSGIVWCHKCNENSLHTMTAQTFSKGRTFFYTANQVLTFGLSLGDTGFNSIAFFNVKYYEGVLLQMMCPVGGLAATNSSLVDDPTIRLPGFQLSQCQWSPLLRFQTGQGHCSIFATEMGSNRLWWHPDNGTYIWLLLSDQTRRLSTTPTRCRDDAAVDWLTSGVNLAQLSEWFL